MKNTVVYVHGKGGSAAEARRYRAVFADCRVIGFDYAAQTLCETMSSFARRIGASLTVMKDGGGLSDLFQKSAAVFCA